MHVCHISISARHHELHDDILPCVLIDFKCWQSFSTLWVVNDIAILDELKCDKREPQARYCAVSTIPTTWRLKKEEHKFKADCFSKIKMILIDFVKYTFLNILLN